MLSMPARRVGSMVDMLLLLVQALALEANERVDDESGGRGGDSEHLEHITFYEITIASVDQPKLLSRLSEALVSAVLVLMLGPACCCRNPLLYPGFRATSAPPWRAPDSGRSAHSPNQLAHSYLNNILALNHLSFIL